MKKNKEKKDIDLKNYVNYFFVLLVYIICAAFIHFLPAEYFTTYDLRLTYANNSNGTASLYYDIGDSFIEGQCVTTDINKKHADFHLNRYIREKAVLYRIDPINSAALMELPLHSLSIISKGKVVQIYQGQALMDMIAFTNDIGDIQIRNNEVILSILGNTPYIVFNEDFAFSTLQHVWRYNKEYWTTMFSVIALLFSICIYFDDQITEYANSLSSRNMLIRRLNTLIKYFLHTLPKLSFIQKAIYVVSFICLILSVIIFSIGNFLLENFNGLSMEEIIFHLKVPMAGTGNDMIIEFLNFSQQPFLVVGSILITSIIILGLWKMIRNCRVINIMILLITTHLLYISIHDIMRDLDFDEYISNQMTASSFIEENYVSLTDVSIAFPEVRRNLVYIYLESMESTFISKQEGGCMVTDIIPELTQLARENINFSESTYIGGATSSVGTGWTVGAMVAQTSGLPLLIPIDGNSYGEYDEFLPGAVSLGDILKENGYNQEIMVGSDLAFGGRRNYFSQHGDYQVYDLYTARESGKIPDDYYVWWGFEDLKLFSYAKEEISRLAKENIPFNFTLLTVDTHHVGGYLCELCQNEHESQYENVLSCSSKQVADLVTWLQNQDFYDDTTIIICGDHPTMDNQYIEEYYDNSKPRKVYNCFINAMGVDALNCKNRDFNTFDLFPTTLAAMGCDISGDRLGLGTNLFSGVPTLAEKYGYEKIDEEFSKTSRFYKKNILKE